MLSNFCSNLGYRREALFFLEKKLLNSLKSHAFHYLHFCGGCYMSLYGCPVPAMLPGGPLLGNKFLSFSNTLKFPPSLWCSRILSLYFHKRGLICWTWQDRCRVSGSFRMENLAESRLGVTEDVALAGLGVSLKWFYFVKAQPHFHTIPGIKPHDPEVSRSITTFE